MATTISGTTITYNDGSTQTTNVPNSTAALSAGGIGTYASMTYPSNSAARSEGFTIAGSSLRFISTQGGTTSGTVPSGSWRLMGYLGSSTVPTPKGGSTTITSTDCIWLRYA